MPDWRKRHPELLPAIRQALDRLPPKSVGPLKGLMLLLEKSPEALAAWALDKTVGPDLKTEVMTILDDELPDELLPVLPAFIAAARALEDTAAAQKGAASYFCDRLFTTLLLHQERALPALPAEARSELRALARKLIPSMDLGAAVILEAVGLPEDADLLELHLPEDPVFGKVYNDAARALRHTPGS